MNDAPHGLLREAAAPLREQTAADIEPHGQRAASVAGGRHATLYGEYLAMLLTMNSGFAALYWAFHLPETLSAGGFVLVCLWSGARSMGWQLQKSTAVPVAAAMVLSAVLLAAREWGNCPPWLAWSPFSPLVITVMAGIVLLQDLAARGEPVSRAQHPTERST